MSNRQKPNHLTNAHTLVDGHLISQEVQRVIEAIRTYSPELEVKWLPPNLREKDQAAFIIYHNDPNLPEPYPIFSVPTEDDMNMSVLQRIIAGDQRNGKKLLSDYEAWEETKKRMAHQVFLDKMEELNDIAAHVLRSPLNTYRVDKDTVFKAGVPGNQAPQKKLIL